MKTTTTQNYLLTAVAILGLAFAQNCGKKDKDDDDKASPKPAPKITSASSEKGNAVFAIDGYESGKMQCRVAIEGASSEYVNWHSCAGSTVSYPVGQANLATLYVREGERGAITSRTLSFNAASTSTTTSVVTTDFGGNEGAQSDAFLFGSKSGGVHVLTKDVVIPNGFFIAKYSDGSGLDGLRVYEVDTQEDPFMRPPICNAQPMFPNVGMFTVSAQSVANGPVHRYCKSAPSAEDLSYWSRQKMARNHIEIVSETGAPFQYLSMIALNLKKPEKVLSRYAQLCEIDDNSVLLNEKGQPMKGTMMLPMINNYFGGELPNKVPFKYCKRKGGTDNGDGGSFYVGSFTSLEIGHTAEIIEFTYISEAGKEWDEFLRDAGNISLNLIHPNMLKKPF